MVSLTSSPFDQLDLAFHFTYKVLKKVLQAQTISGFVVHQQQMMISTNEESQSKKIHGLVEFTQPVRLNKVQQGQANGYKENVIIDWGDFERQKWDQLSPKIESIKCKQLSLRNNRNRNLIMNVKHISFPHLVVLNLGSNKICSLQVLPSFNLPVLRQLNLDDNFIISTRSFVKAHLPQLKTIRLQNNPLVENSRMFQGLFPKLREYWLDIDTTKEYTYGTLKLTDQVTWRVKHAPKLTKQSQLNRGNRMNYHYRRYGYELDHFQPKRLTFIKYVEMLNQKPEYFKTQMVQQ